MPVLTRVKQLVSISVNNRKTKTPSVSLPPGETCIPGAKCFTCNGCYAWKMYFNTAGCYTNVKSAWDRNLAIYRESANDYFNQVYLWLKDNTPEFFRWHVGGDFPDMSYFNWVREIAAQTPSTRHTAYTKRYDWLPVSPASLGENLNVMPSGWPGIDMPDRVREAYGVFWLLDGDSPDPRIPEDTPICPGSCPECRWCWDTFRDVTNHKH